MNVVSDSDIAAAAALDHLADACALVEQIAGIEKGSMVVQHIEDEIVWWFVFDDPEYRAERLQHWITAERLYRALMQNKENPEVPA